MMLNGMVKENLRSTLLVASTFAALMTGTGMAVAQVADDPPGSQFQDQGIREENGIPPLGEEYRAPRGAYGTYAPRRTYAAPNGSHRSDVARHQHERSDQSND